MTNEMRTNTEKVINIEYLEREEYFNKNDLYQEKIDGEASFVDFS